MEGHSRRLVDLSSRLATALGLSTEEIDHLRRGVLLHDIGKLAIPDEILLKPGALNDAERRLMQQHPVFAKQMLSQVSFLQPAIDVAYSHHERWDGLGYPQGLKGDAIPLSARLFPSSINGTHLPRIVPTGEPGQKKRRLPIFRKCRENIRPTNRQCLPHDNLRKGKGFALSPEFRLGVQPCGEQR